MKVSVWDTYVVRENGKTMHFDILVPFTMEDKDSIFNYGRAFLLTKPFKTAGLSTKECQFCHIEQAGHIIKEAINEKGYFIIEMENCQ